MSSLLIAQPSGFTTNEILIGSYGWHRRSNVLPMSVRLRWLDIGFQAIQL
jgi:hypothetical protein